jgi:hypothetical protein
MHVSGVKSPTRIREDPDLRLLSCALPKARSLGEVKKPMESWSLLGVLGLLLAGSAQAQNNVVSIVADGSVASIGAQTSVVLASDGLPLVLYRQQGLRAAKCANPDCSVVSSAGTVDIGSAGGFMSAVVPPDGRPIISYWSLVNRALLVARCFNSACSGTPAAEISVVDDPANGDEVGEFTSIALGNDGFPVISYYDRTNGRLKVAKCGDLNCTVAMATISVIAGGVGTADADVGQYSSLVVPADGRPLISYYDFDQPTNGRLRLARCANAACTGTATSNVVHDAAVDLGQYSALALGADGFPVMSYYDNGANTVRVARCGTISCSGSITRTELSQQGPEGRYTDIAVGTDGLPVVSFLSDTQGLRVARCLVPTCATGATLTTVDSAESAGFYTAIVINPANNTPVVSYQRGASQVRVATCGLPSCQTAADFVVFTDGFEDSSPPLVHRAQRKQLHAKPGHARFPTSAKPGSAALSRTPIESLRGRSTERPRTSSSSRSTSSPNSPRWSPRRVPTSRASTLSSPRTPACARS